MYRAKFKEGSKANKVLAEAIFTASLEQSRQKLLEEIFHPRIDGELFLDILNRPGQDTNVDYVRFVFNEIESGTITKISIENAIMLIRDYNAASLKNFIVKTERELERDNNNAAPQPMMMMGEEERLMAQLTSLAQGVMSANEVLDNMTQAEKDAAPTVDEEAQPEVDVRKIFWKPEHLPPMDLSRYSWFWTIFFRVNGAYNLHRGTIDNKDKIQCRKLQRYLMAHYKIINYLEKQSENVHDAVVGDQVESMYEPLGTSHYESDRGFVKVTRELHQLRETPLQILRRAFPNEYWTPEEVSAAIRNNTFDRRFLTPYVDGEWNPLGGASPPLIDTHTLFYGVVYVLNLCRHYMKKQQSNEIRDAAWTYYVSFVDLFHFSPVRLDDEFLLQPLGSYVSQHNKTFVNSEKATPWQLYGTCDTRAFTCYDLPDLYHVMSHIPLNGEQFTPPFHVAKIFSKCYPFACHRRHLIKLVTKCIMEHPAFWSYFRHLVWVLLANLYFPFYSEEAERVLTMRQLLRIRDLCNDKELLISSLTPANAREQGANGAPLVMTSFFRMHIHFIALRNPQYIEVASKFIDWNHFLQDTLKIANVVRSFPLFAENNPFGAARLQLSKTVKSPQSQIYRLKRHSCSLMISEHCNTLLEKRMMKERHSFQKDKEKFQAADSLVEKRARIDEVHELFDPILAETHLGKLLEKKCGADKTLYYSSLEEFSTFLGKFF
jgi:hypothetical protein